MTKRDQITGKIKTYLDAITTNGGYKVTFPAAKIWSPYVENPSDGLKFVSIKDTVNTHAKEDDSDIKKMLIEIIMQCCVKDANYSTILNMVDDVYKCIYTNRRTIEKDLSAYINPVSDEVAILNNEREFGVAKVIFEITHSQHAEWIYEAVS